MAAKTRFFKAIFGRIGALLKILSAFEPLPKKKVS